MSARKEILVINAGSSSVKFAIFDKAQDMKTLCRGLVDRGKDDFYVVHLQDGEDGPKVQHSLNVKRPEEIYGAFMEWIFKTYKDVEFAAVGHRVVHGGVNFKQSTVITDAVYQELEALVPLAPLHQPYNLKPIKAIKDTYPKLPQVACFDTAFHAEQKWLAKTFSLPKELEREGILRYGFHGLSYEFITKELAIIDPKSVNQKVLVAHLGNGSSACAIASQKSVASSMGFTALDGLFMGTRCGAIDAGVVMHLLEGKGLKIAEVHNILYKKSGLIGLSGGISNDMRELENSNNPRAKEAVEAYCYRAATQMGMLATAMQGLDQIVFTAGIGQNAANIRNKICSYFSWLGVVIDEARNKANNSIISTDSSKIIVRVISTNEEKMIALSTSELIKL